MSLAAVTGDSLAQQERGLLVDLRRRGLLGERLAAQALAASLQKKSSVVLLLGRSNLALVGTLGFCFIFLTV